VSTQRAPPITLIMSSAKVTSSPPVLAQALLMPWGATKIVVLFDWESIP